MNNEEKLIGYTTGVFDLFHVGHVRLLKKARGLCDYLIVGVTTDEASSYKNKIPVIPFNERCEIVESIEYVDCVVPQEDHNKLDAWERYKFDVMFVGDDWYQNEKWELYESELKKIDVRVIYFPYTKGTSSSLINDTLGKLREG